MATYYSSRMTSPIKPPRAGIGEVVSVVATYVANDAVNELVVNNVIQMAKVPKGAVMLDVILTATDMEGTNGAGALSVGDVNAANRFITGSNVTIAGGVARVNQGGVNSIGYKYTQDEILAITITTNAVNAANGTFVLAALYAMQL